LGLTQEVEELIRKTFEDEKGLLVVDQVLPGGPSYDYLEPGDLIIRLNGHLVTKFLLFESILDDSVDENIHIEVQRGGVTMYFKTKVQDLHSITPNEYLEFGGGIINELSYQIAHSYCISVNGLFLSSSGYMFGLAGISSSSLILSVDNQPISTINDFKDVMTKIPQGKRIVVRYINLNDPHRQRVSIVPMYTCWHPFRDAIRDDELGIWKYHELPLTNEKYVYEVASASYSYINSNLSFLNDIQKSLVEVECHIPFSIDGIYTNNVSIYLVFSII
jgi:hypothetical protein